MNRRSFLKSAGAAIVAGYFARSAAAGTETPSPPPDSPHSPDDPPISSCDVFVYGSTPGGVAAALFAARGGCRVILACPKMHPGGMLASGLGGLDTRRRDLLSGFVLEYREVRLTELRRLEAAGVPAWQRGVPGHGGSAPSFAERIFEDLLAAQAERLAFWRRHHLTAAITRHGRIVEVSLEPEGPAGVRRRVAAKTFIDATYEGDLAAAAAVPFRVGRESRDEFGEPLAGICYFDSKRGKEIITPDTGSASPAIQAYCARCVITTDPNKLVPFEKPASYENHLPDLWPLLNDFLSGRLKNRSYGKPLPGLKWELNGSIDLPTSLDVPGVSWAWPEANRAHRRRLEQFHLDHAASFFWFLQNEPRMPAHVRAQWRLAGRHRDEFADNNHWPWQIYVRQGRRIEGREQVTQHNFTVQSRTGLTPRLTQPIAIGDFTIDVHACHDRRFAEQGCLEGAIWFRETIPSPAQAGQIPYGALLPRQLDNLLVPLALSSSHIGMSVVRMEPVWMITGQVAGLAAAEAQSSGLDVAQIDPNPLLRRAGIITDPGPPRYS
jgi:hypothetical protein